MKLEKNQTIELSRKPNSKTHVISMGINWGALQQKKFFRTVSIPIDLDACAALYKAEGDLEETVSFKHTTSRHYAVMHSGDDKDGDTDGDDQLDNETITIDLSRVDKRVSQIVLFVTSYDEHDFSLIPYANVCAYKHHDDNSRDLLAQFDINSDPSFANCNSMILAVVFRRGGRWFFHTIGEPTEGKNINQLELIIQNNYLKRYQ